MTEIRNWLNSIGLEEYTEVFVSNRIDSDVLPDITEADLEKLEIPLGDRKRLLKAIANIRSTQELSSAETDGVKIADQPDSESAQRRQLTFVFADLVGSTSISERLDPEEYRAIIQKVHEVYTRIIERHHGWIAQYQGDGIFAYFGYPRAGEDDAERAVTASLLIVNAIQNISTDSDVSLHVRVGIATGLVVIGDLVGEGIHEKSTVMGDTPNIGSKIQLLAAPDTVVISDVTKRLLGRQFVCEDLGLKRIAGMTQPVRMWWVIKETTTTTRFEARRYGTLSKFIGHEDEVALLQRRWQQSLGMEPSLTANGQVVLISGEPGIGKSRLTQVLCENVSENHTTLHYQCSLHHKDSALHPIIMQLASNAGFDAGDTSEKKLEKLISLIGEADNSASIIVPVFAYLLSIATNKSDSLVDKTPTQIKDLTLDSLLDRYVNLAKYKPLLIVFEDLQWIDPTSQELIDLLVTKIEDMEAILLVTYRPEYVAPWVGQPHVTTLNLGRLNHTQSCAVIEQQTGGHDLPGHLVDLIITKTDGVPLFLEELTKAVLESKTLQLKDGSYTLQENLHELILPVTLQDSLMARLDRLPDARELAPIGATIGRTFSYALLAAVTGLDADTLRSGLDQLIDAQLLFEHGRLPDSTYTFKHALVQDVAYESQLKSSRALVHEKIANTLVSDERNLGRSRPEVVAFHYQKAGKYEEAFEYWIRAGTNGLEAGATAETVKLLQNASGFLSTCEETEANRPARLKYYILRGKALNASIGAKSKDAERAFKDASIIAEKMGDTDAQIHALDSEFGIIFNSGDTKRSIGPATEMIKVGEARNHRVGTICGLQSMGMVMFTRGEFARAKTYLEDALVDSKENVTGINSYPSLALMYLAWTSYILGDKKKGIECCEASIESGRSEIPYSFAVSLGNSCYLYQFANDYPSIERNATALVDLARSKGQLMWLSRGLFFNHWIRANRGKHTESLLDMEKEVEKLLEANEEIEITYYLGLIAATQINLGQFEKARESLDLAMQKVEKNGETFYQAELLRIHGDLIQRAGAATSDKNAERYYRKSLDIAKAQSAKLWEEKAILALSGV
jgi:class 3 adenylate cyclase/tetratricopeptide (TPR) repeat protein